MTIEDPLEPELAICDPHHYLWDRRTTRVSERYLLDEVLEDTGSGHKVLATVFIECGAMYRADGPEASRVVGETEFENGIAAMSASGLYGSTRIAAGIVGTADLRRGDAVAEVLDAQLAAGGGRFRGIRQGAAWDPDAAVPPGRVSPGQGLLLHDDFRAGFKHLAPRQLSFEAWCYHPQIPDVTSLARAFPDTTIILDHFGGPLGVGSYASHRDDVCAAWRTSISELAACPSVVAKLGGINMEVNRFGWHERPRPPSSEELVQATRRYYEIHDREVRRRSLHVRVEFSGRQSQLQLYGVVELVQAFLTAGYSAHERAKLFHDTAARVYRLEPAPVLAASAPQRAGSSGRRAHDVETARHSNPVYADVGGDGESQAAADVSPAIAEC